MNEFYFKHLVTPKLVEDIVNNSIEGFFLSKLTIYAVLPKNVNSFEKYVPFNEE